VLVQLYSSQRSSVNTLKASPLTSSDASAGKRRTSMPTASSVVSRLSTSRITSASCTAFHPAHTSRTVGRRSERTQAALLPPSYL
jgi:hypothetical protein